MRFKNRARMMQPPRQIVAIAPRSLSQPYSALAAAIWSKPCAYATTFDAYSALRTSSTKVARSGAGGTDDGPGNAERAAARWSAWPDRDRATVASAMAVTGRWTVQTALDLGIPVTGI